MPSIRCGLCHRVNKSAVCAECAAREIKAGRRDPRSSHERGYGVEWRALRKQIIGEHPWCSICGRRAGEYEVDPETGAATKRVKLSVDHIVPKVRGGTDDRSNLRVLCGSCNSRKSWTSDRRRRAM